MRRHWARSEDHNVTRLAESQEFNVQSCGFNKFSAIVLVEDVMMKTSVLRLAMTSSGTEQSYQLLYPLKDRGVEEFLQGAFGLIRQFRMHGHPTCAGLGSEHDDNQMCNDSGGGL